MQPIDIPIDNAAIIWRDESGHIVADSRAEGASLRKEVRAEIAAMKEPKAKATRVHAPKPKKALVAAQPAQTPMSTQDEIDRLNKLHRRALDHKLDTSPEDRATLRALVDRIAGLYSRLVRERSPG
ncbi:MAG TPA: hypothetical protein VMP86_07720 [Candidatus Binatia bacterium]|nr:hypothetical protein [Candidatus Binatia bacterium]